jgi:hypothetical protein
VLIVVNVFVVDLFNNTKLQWGQSATVAKSMVVVAEAMVRTKASIFSFGMFRDIEVYLGKFLLPFCYSQYAKY